jgi:hypothetical protein
MSQPASWPRVAWSLVHPGDQVYAADRHVWDVLERDGTLVTIGRQDGGQVRRMSRINPPGDVPCQRGRQWRELTAAVAVFRAGGLPVDLIGTYRLPDVDVVVPAG